MAFSGLGSGTSGDPYQITTVAQYLEMDGSGNAGLYFLLMNDLDVCGTTSISLYCHFDGGNHRLTKDGSTGYAVYTSSVSNITIVLATSTNVGGSTYVFNIREYLSPNFIITNITVINNSGYPIMFMKPLSGSTLNAGIVINGCKLDGHWGNIFPATVKITIYDFIVLNLSTSPLPFIQYASTGFHMERFYYYAPYIKSTATLASVKELFRSISADATIKQGYITINYWNLDAATTGNGNIILGTFGSTAGNYVFQDVYIKITKAITSVNNSNGIGLFGNTNQNLSGFSGTYSFKNFLFEGDLECPHFERTRTLSRITPIGDTYYNKDLLESIQGVDSTGETGLTTAQILQESSFANWDFVNVWEMTIEGPRLRTISYDQEFEHIKEFVIIPSKISRISSTSLSFSMETSSTGNIYVDVKDELNATIFQQTYSGEFYYDVLITSLPEQDQLYTILISIIVDGETILYNSTTYDHVYLDSGNTITNITVSTYDALTDGTNYGRWMHGTVMVGSAVYSSARASSISGNDPGVIAKVPISNPSSFSLFPIVDENASQYNNMDFMVNIGKYLYTVATRYDTGSGFLIVRFDTETDTYKYFHGNYISFYNSCSTTDGTYWYLIAQYSSTQRLLKIDPAIFDQYQNGDNIDLSTIQQVVIESQVESGYGVHSMIVDSTYIYLAFTYSVQPNDPGELQKRSLSTLELIDYCPCPPSTDDMTQNATHLFLGIENKYSSNLDPEDVYYYQVGVCAVRKSDLNTTFLRRLHVTEIPGGTVSYASTVFGNYLFDCKTNHYIYVIDISDPDSWSMSELVGSRTVKAYYLYTPGGIYPVAYPINEIVRVDSVGGFIGFAWRNPSDVSSFVLTDLSFVSEPTVETVNAVVDGISVELNGYTINNGGYEVTECGFVIGNQIDLSDGVIYICDDIETNFHKTIELLELDIYYWQAYAINEIGTGYGAIESFIIEELLSPSTETISVTNRTISSAKINAAVTDLGSTSVIDHGVCYSDTNSIPTLNDTVVSLGSINSIGNFYADLINLIENTRYYVCSYAINSVGVNYGNVLDFWTITKPGIPENISSELIIEVQITFSIPSNLGNGTFLGFKIESKVLNGDWEVLQSLWTETTYACFITGKCWFRFTTITVEYGEGDATEEIEIRTGTDAYPYRIYLGSNEIIIQ